MQFIPRAAVFISIFFFYARLYVFLKRPDRIRASFSPSPGGRSTGGGTWQTDSSGSSGTVEGDGDPADRHGRSRRLRRRSRASSRERIREGFRSFSFKPKAFGCKEGKQARDDEIRLGNVQGDERNVQGRDFASEKTPREQTGRVSGNGKSTGEIPPWERLELPPFEVDGQRYGGSGPSVLTSSGPAGFWGDFKIGRKRATSSAHSGRTEGGMTGQRSSREGNTTSGIRSRESSVAMTAPPRGSSGPPFLPPVVPEESTTFTAKVTEPSPIATHSSTFTADYLGSSSVFDRPRRHPGELKMPYSVHEVDPKDASEDYRVPLAPALPATGNLTPSTSSSIQPLLPAIRRGSADPHAHGQNGIRKDSCQASSESESRRGSGPVSFVLPTYPRKESAMGNVDGAESSRGRDGSAGEMGRNSIGRAGSTDDEEEEDEEEDGEMDFGQFLRQEDEARGEDGRDRRQASEDSILQQESTASYLNRKTAMLMLYFPLA